MTAIRSSNTIGNSLRALLISMHILDKQLHLSLTDGIILGLKAFNKTELRGLRTGTSCVSLF